MSSSTTSVRPVSAAATDSSKSHTSKRTSRSGRPLSLLFIDLDGFKAVNDTHGHLFGSRALVEAAAVIRRCARETDVVARFGGDEFALVLPDTGGEGAFAVGERAGDAPRRGHQRSAHVPDAGGDGGYSRWATERCTAAGDIAGCGVGARARV